MKDKLFFVNGELTTNNRPSQNVSLTQGTKIADNQALAERMYNILKNKYNFDAGNIW